MRYINYLFVLVIMCACLHLSFGQQHKIDSMTRVPKAVRVDTIKGKYFSLNLTKWRSGYAASPLFGNGEGFRLGLAILL
jgi:hypothetical protein